MNFRFINWIPLKVKREVNVLLTSLVALCSLYATFVAIFERPLLSPLSPPASSNNNHPNVSSNGTIDNSFGQQGREDVAISQLVDSFFSIFVLWVSALCAGRLLQYAQLPPLFGMLLVGIAFTNIPPLRASILIRPSWDNFLRKTAFVLILIRCAIGLNPQTLRKSFIFCATLGILSTIVEIIAILLCAHFLFNVSLASSILFGFVLASTSPAVTVPTMIHFQLRKMGTQNGIPTMALASASIDNIFSISGFTIAYAVASASSGQLVSTLIRIPIQLLVALALGCFTGALLMFLPHSKGPCVHFARTLLLCSTSMAIYFGSKAANLEVSGPIALIIACFIAGVRWKADNPREAKMEAEALRLIWDLLLLPLLFVLIGFLFNISIFTWALLKNALFVIAVGIAVRVVAVFLLTLFSAQFKCSERLFFSIVFLPKATVQAALAPMLFAFVTSHGEAEKDSAQFVLQTCILSILLTAPAGQLLIQLLGNKLLAKEEEEKEATKSPKSSHLGRMSATYPVAMDGSNGNKRKSIEEPIV